MAAITPGTLADVAVDPALAELYEAKAQTYAAFGNGAIAAHAERLLPAGGRVLDVGCASGGLLALLRPRAGHLAGLELSATGRARGGAGRRPRRAGRARGSRAAVRGGLLRPRRARRRARAPRRPGGGAAAGGGLVPARRRGPRQRAERRALAGAPDAAARALAADRQRHVRRQPPALVHPRRARRRCSPAPGCATSSSTRSCPALRNHPPAGGGAARRRLEPAWQALGRRAPGLLGYQVIGVGRR